MEILLTIIAILGITAIAGMFYFVLLIIYEDKINYKHKKSKRHALRKL
jgi:hypothetical protein